MQISIMKAMNKNTQKTLSFIAAAFFWLIIWQIASVIIDKPIVLVSPINVVKRLFELVFERSFWHSAMFSMIRIGAGFLLSLVLGCVFAVLASYIKIFEILLSPLNSVIKSTPIASFVILVLLWIPSKNLSVIIPFLMSFPVIYSNMLSGIRNVDKKLIEMADVFKIPAYKRFLYIYLPDVMPFFISACNISVGLCWKSGIAAEVIGLPSGSIGDMLYHAKIYLETADLFAWTVVIIIISTLFEKILLLLLKVITKKIEKGGISTKGA